MLDDAVNYYFGVNDSDAVRAIQSIGLLNEKIIGIIGQKTIVFFPKNSPSILL